MNIPYTNLRVPYAVCASYIANNLRRDLVVHILNHKRSDTISMITLADIKEFSINEMIENNCEKYECIYGMVKYKGNVYEFRTHHYAYDAVLSMTNVYNTNDKIKMILPITTLEHKNKIHIPEEFTNDIKIVPVEFVWEFLSQISGFLKEEELP